MLSNEDKAELMTRGFDKFPVSRPRTGHLLKVVGPDNAIEKIGIAVATKESGVVIVINGQPFDSNNVLYWQYSEAAQRI